MRHLTLFVLLLALFALPTPAHAQTCTPPLDAQLVATNATGQYTAWAIGPSVVWCSSGGTVTTYESTYISILYFDGYWLPYNLYWGSSDGYLFQMNVSTGIGYLISPHGQPPGDEGGIGGNPPAAVMIETPPATSAEPQPTVRQKYHGLNLETWRVNRRGG